ncbi:MAG: Y-family DNA polymerase [Moraxellaceae bacterium]|nr:Y-family DNA polymerase [Moraxellaceae bacterium]MDZ4387550.1 Y-family DNA polymerase [Moraxellaceae bacterium]
MPVYALVDANNFYATCEKIFAPELMDKPLVVLSNNDGCIVARSAEAKALGIPMAAPIHQHRHFCQQHGVVIKSSNYTLYGDMSARMLSILQDMCPRVESYSIDESFLDLAGFPDITQYAYEIRRQLRRQVKLSCGIGIGPTKTLAKFANHIAKNQLYWGGVFNALDHPSDMLDALMAQYPVSEVWGVGRRLTVRLNADGINTVLDLKHCGPIAIRKRYGIVLEKTVRELNGESCLAIAEVGEPRQQIIASRSFGTVTQDVDAIQTAICHHVSRAAEKLRQQHSVAQHVYVMIRTNPFRDQDVPYRRSTLVPLAYPSADTAILMSAALAGLQQIFKPGLKYHKCGVMLGQIAPVGNVQPDLFSPSDDPKRLRLMALMDNINRVHGSNMLRFASLDLSNSWRMRAGGRSPCYTTDWRALPVVFCR